MGYRYGWIAGAAGILFALARLERLLRSSVEGLPWELILLASIVLGGSITWAAVAYRLGTSLVVTANVAAMLLAVVRIAVPSTTWLVFPTLSSFTQLGGELRYAAGVIRSGVAPVLPLAGLIAVLSVVFWVLGALLSWGLLRDRPYTAVLAPLVVYLQFSTIDRVRSGYWTFLFLLLLGLCLLAVALDRRRQGTGLLTTGVGRTAVVRTIPSLAAAALAVVLVGTVLATNAMAGLVPRSGLIDWRVPSALAGDFYGSVSYNPFVGIRQRLASEANVPVFVAEVEGGLRYDQVYFRLLTLETFNGAQWYANRPEVGRPEEIEGYESADHAFLGPSTEVRQTITILALQQDWLPAAYSPTGLSAGNRAVERGFRVKVDDGSLHFDALTYRGMTYTVVSAVPQPDLAVLALDGEGRPSPVFAEASAAEEGFEMGPGEPLAARSLPDADRYLSLPAGLDPGIAALARRQVRGLATAFERGLALESFFRSGRYFRYSLEVEPGHAATDLAAWLLDPQSPNYRTGYCEQFATAMAVMARQVGIPSRVVLGFAPGQQLEDGRIVVRDRNAHAWVELWMPTQGWVRFDPTPRGDGVNPATLSDLPFDLALYLQISESVPPFDTGPNRPQIPFIDDEIPDIPPLLPDDVGDLGALRVPAWLTLTALGLLALFGLVPAIKWLRRRHRLRLLSTGDVSAAWREIVDRLSDLGDEPSPASTPLEVATATDRAMAPLAQVYGETVYGMPRGRAFDLRQVVLATESLRETEGRLASRYSLPVRLLSWYRLRSLTPRWWRRRAASA